MAARPEAWALVLAVLPAAVAVAVLGRLHPDEVYQFLEPAYARVHGYGVLAWEWRDGLRNWAAPLAIAAVLAPATLVGVTDPWWVRGLVAVPLWALQAWALVAAVRLARRRASGGAWLAGWTVLAAFAAFPLWRAVAGRTLGEPLSAAVLVVAAEALSRDDGRRRSGALGGAALGFAFVLRYGSVLAVVAALAWLAARRRWRELAGACAGLGAVLLALGLLDWATWGAPFHSVFAWARFNVFSDGAVRAFGAEPSGWYGPFLWAETPSWVWAGLVLSLALCRPRPGVAGTMAAALLAGMLRTPHKEERFLIPVLVLLVVEATPGVAALLARIRARGVALALGALAVVTGLRASGPTTDLRGDQFRALVKSTRGDDVHGLLIVNEGLWGAGGFFYVGKRIPWLTCDFPQDANFQRAVRDRRFDRAITFEGRALPELQAAGFRITGVEGRETMLARP